jgi:hypothetical protein
LKVAVTAAAATSDTEQLALVPVHAPDQPANMLPAVAVAVSVTMALGSNALEHVDPQAIPLGFDATDPAPDTDTVSIGRTVNSASTFFAVSSVTEHVDSEPEHAPDQPVNADEASGDALNTIDVPGAYPSLHDVPQSMPTGFDVTCPLPVPAVPTLNITSCVNFALTLVAAFMTTVHIVAAPLHPPPDHPLNTESFACDAVSVTLVPGA